MVSQAELILRVITLWFLILSQFFRDGMGPFKTTCSYENTKLMVNAHFHDATTIKFGEKSMTTLKTLFYVSSAKKTRILTLF